MSSQRELKSPFIDTMTQEGFEQSVLSSFLLNINDSSNQAENIKVSLDSVKQHLSLVNPNIKKLDHSTISALYYSSRDQLICLCNDGTLVSLFIMKREKRTESLDSRLERIYYTKDDSKFIASSKEFVMLFKCHSLETIQKVPVSAVLGTCEFLPFEQILFKKTEILTFSLKTFNIESKMNFNEILNVNFTKDDHIVVLEKNSIKKISKQFQFVNEVTVENAKLCKLCENSDKIIVKLLKNILIFNAQLVVIKQFEMKFEITDIIYEECSQIMIISTARGDIIFCDIRMPVRKIPIKVHKMSIPNIFLQHYKVISVSEDLQIAATKIPKLKNTYIKELKILAITTSPNPFIFYYISESLEVFFWNFKENLTKCLYKDEGLCPVLVFHEERLYLNTASDLIQINLQTSKVQKEVKKEPKSYLSMNVINPDNLACFGRSNSIIIYKLETFEFLTEIVAHGQRVTCMSSYEKVLVSGSFDKTVKIWNMVDFSILHTLHGHSKPVTEVLVIKGKAFSASQDRSIRIWYVKTGELIHSIQSVSGVIRFMVLTNQEYLLTCNNFGLLTYWNLVTYAKVLETSLYGPIIQFRANDDTIIYCSDSFLVTYLNPLKGKKIVITGPKETDTFKTYKYLKKILNNKSVSFNPICDKWVIFPHILTPLHLYAYFNLPDHVSESLKNKSSLVQSRLKQSPLSISVSRDLESCVSNIIKLIKPTLAENPFLLNFIDDQCLIEMNWTGHDSLAMFYKVFFQEVTTDSLPRFIKHEVKLPIYAKSVGMIPKSQSFVHESKKSDTGQAVVFQRSLGRLSLAMGSKPSIKLLRSIVECKNYEIFKTPFIRAYIQHKWESVKLFMWLQFLIYFSYLVYFGLYLMQIYSNVIFLIIPLILSCILTLYEIYKAFVSGYEYFLVLWNYLDAARAVLFLVYFYQQWQENQDSSIDDQEDSDYVLLVLVIVSFIKGLSYFRLFHHTRHFIHLLSQVLIDSYAFIIILAYNTVAFGFIMLVAFTFEHDLSYYMGQSFQINLALNDPSDFGPTQWVVYSFGIALNNWVMMSVLISLYGETFDNVQEVADVENTRTLAVMSLEAERNIFWKRGKTRKSYLQMCSKGKWNSETDPAVEKVKDLKRIAKDNRKEIGFMKMEILDCLKKQRIKEKSKAAGLKNKDMVRKLFRVLFAEYGINRIDKEKVVKKVEKMIKILI